ncbi:hypothetical protein Cwoe_5122 [Conexibacter woesei DSM 14684]|uniref:Uncharacterized protein n=2 Tax=Conexibacter TaxID=191494 RepID=D3FDD9_CONWI|nr:hypothetical protein Cwoe_5122 [Conexibacter woesei DSM 14684]
MRFRLRRLMAVPLVAAAVLAVGSTAAWAVPPPCPSGTPTSFLQDSVGGDGNAVYGGYHLGDSFVARGGSITQLTVWMKQAANAPVTLSVISGSSIGGTVVGTATIASGVSGKAVATLARPIAVTLGATYILKVNAPAATRGLAELIPSATGEVYARDGSHGNTDYRASGWEMAMGVDFCGAGIGGCTIGAPATVSQYASTGDGNAIFGGYYLGDSFVAGGSAITKLTVWMEQAADAPVTLSVISGSAIGGTVVGTATLASGVSGKAEVALATPIAVRAGSTYILKVNAPAATRGTARLIATSGEVYARDGSHGNTDYRATGWDMALQVDFCGAPDTVDTFPPTSGDFGPVHGTDFAAESFTASDETLYDASIWLTEATDGPLSITVHRDTPDGATVATAALAASPIGKRTVVFSPAVRLTRGGRYVLAVRGGSVETHTGIVARRADDPTQQGWDASGPVTWDLALELSFGPGISSPSDLTREQCTDRLAFPAGYVASVETAMRSKPDVWGNALMASASGPTYDNVKDYLLPLRYVGSPAGMSGNQLTDSGVFYVAFGAPGTDFSQPGALHVADGSQVVSRAANGRRATVYVGGAGARERFGLCEARLQEPALADGHQPVLQTDYVDADGVQYRQESFVAHLPSTSTPASFVKITAQRGSSALGATDLRIATGDTALVDAGGSLTSGGNVVMYDGAGWTLESGSQLRARVDLSDGLPHSLYFVRPVNPATPTTFTADATSYATALAGLKSAWNTKLASGATYDVPEQRVMDAQRNLLIQNLQLGWRYSYGNAYESFYQPESSSAVQRLGEYGFTTEARAGLQALVGMSKGTGYPNWERGEKLSHAAAYWFLTGDTAFIRANTATYASYMAAMAAERARDPNGLLPKEFEGGDIPTRIYGTHTQTVGWRGMRDMALVWRLIGERSLAATYEPEAAAFGRALRTAIDSSKRTVGRSTFIPHDLLSGELPFDPVTGTKIGSYWNLLHPYALASGIFTPGSAEADSVWAYSRDEGALLLGLQRFNYYPTRIGSVTPGGLPGYKTDGDDSVYAVERIRFLAAQDDPEQLVLALYGKLAHGMTRKTFIAGEGHTIAPVPGEYFRSMYLSPTNANNDFFLVTLREMLVHVGEGTDGVPDSLRLAYSTPRGWLEDGKSITVANAPTTFGQVGYRITSQLARRTVAVTVTLPPPSAAMREARLRLRLPAGNAIGTATVVGRGTAVPFTGDTLDLAGLSGTVQVQVTVR